MMKRHFLNVLTSKESTMKCYGCNGVIINGYFTAWINGKRMDFHPNCKPFFTYNKPDQPLTGTPLPILEKS